ncbi:protein sidekick-2-like [Haliotis rubra]|uniref:protein sidekick-2-like n=1 Tax=Haliotis rubra TaxID=36100 RepID=UPI001EE578AD|nr:protein sidekick-2-like [Haliotis rubra]
MSYSETKPLTVTTYMDPYPITLKQSYPNALEIEWLSPSDNSVARHTFWYSTKKGSEGRTTPIKITKNNTKYTELIPHLDTNTEYTFQIRTMYKTPPFWFYSWPGNNSLTFKTLKQTSIVAAPSDLVLNPGDVATFECGATTDLRTTLMYNWLRDAVPIDEADMPVVVKEGSLTILNVSSEDTATYTCVAHNGIDNDTASAKLQVRAPPSAPDNVVITACYANYANVEWSFGKTQESFSPLLGFIVEYNTSFTPNEWIVGARTSSDSRSTQIQLSSWVTYSFRVKAFNVIGEGEPGDISPIKCRTPQSRPDRHPRNVKTVGDQTNVLVVEWETMPQIEHNGPHFFYSIEVKEKDGDILMNFVEHDYSVGRKEIHTGTIYKPYIIQVKSQNSMGRPFLKAQAITGYSGEGVPTVAPTNFELDSEMDVTATSARFRWDPVSTSAEVIRGEYRGYKVRHWKRNQKETSLREVFIPDSTEANSKQRLRRTGNKVWVDVHSLPPYSHVEADVVAVNTYFSSEGSNILRFSTAEGVPSSVEYVNVTYRGSEDIELEWGQPGEPNGIVIGYRVGYRKVQGLHYGDLEISEIIAERRMLLGGLTPDTYYRVYVWGLTRVGRGEEYYTDIRTAEETPAPPSAPDNVVITACYANRANVEWSFDKTQENFSPLLGFIVEYNTSFTPNEWAVGARTSPNSRSARIQLSPWGSYSFRVKALNEIGTGEPGDISPAKCRTPPSRPDRHPRNVKTVGDKTNFLVVEWETMPQIEHNAPDFSYSIEVKEKDGDIMMNFVEHDYTVSRKEIYTGTIYKPYIIQVKARNSVGRPFVQAQAIIGYSGEGAPTVLPTNFELASERNVTATSARFRWDPVSTSTEVILGEYRGYKIRHWKRNQKEASLREVFIPDSTEANSEQMLRRTGNKVWVDVHNLPPYSHIEADVVVVNTYFNSEGSNILHFSTAEGLPSSVEDVNITYRGSEDIELEWGQPGEPNGIIIGYQVGYRKVEGLEFGDLEISRFVAKRRMTLRGLTPDTAYRVYVWGMTRIGRGEEFFIDIRTAEETPETIEIHTGPRDLALVQGNEAVFTCGARAGPRKTVEYKWLRNGVRIEEGDPQVKIEEGSLTILNVTSSDTANYTCVAYRGINNATATAKLQVSAHPAAPDNVVITACFANHANVEWSFDKTQENVSPLLGFIVEYNTSFTPNEWIVGARTSSDSRSTRIQLSSWAIYSFRVKAFNMIGEGEPGDISPAKCRTPPSRPDRHPRNVKTVGDKTNFLVVEWETMPQIEHNAPDFSYSIEVKEKDGDILMNFMEHDYTVGRKEIYTGTVYKPYI